MNWRGPKTRAWEKARRELKEQFLAWGITRCELMYAGCQRDNALGFAHAVKRSQQPEMYRDEALLKQVCLACNRCHDLIEQMPAEEMERIVTRVIELRSKILSSTFIYSQPRSN